MHTMLLCLCHHCIMHATGLVCQALHHCACTASMQLAQTFSPACNLLSHGLYSVYSGKHNKTCFAVAACCLLPHYSAASSAALICTCIINQLLCYAGTGAMLSKGSQLWYSSSPLLCAIPLTRTSQRICCHLHLKLLMTLPLLVVTPFTLDPQSPQQQLCIQLCCSCKLLPNKQTSLHLKLLPTVRTSQCLQLASLEQQRLMMSSQMYCPA